MRLATTAVSPAHPAAKLLVPDRSTVLYAVASSAPPTASRIPDIIFLAVTEQSAVTVHNQNPRPPGQQSYTTISRLLPAALTYAHRLPFFALPFCVSRICSGVSPACNSGRSTAPASRLPPAWSLAAVFLHRCISSADAVHHVARRVSVLRSHGAIHHEVRRHILWHLIYLITDVMHRRATVRTWITVTGPNLRY